MQVHPWTEVVYQNLESKKALFYIFHSTGSVFENSSDGSNTILMTIGLALTVFLNIKRTPKYS